MDFFDGLFVTLACPNCNYGIDVELLSIRLEAMTFGPCCKEKWLRKSEQGDKWNRCLIEGMIVLSETGARDEQTTPP